MDVAETGRRPHRRITVCGATDAGRVRGLNEDTFVIAELETGRISRPCIRTEVWIARPGVLMLVCDGMGGPPAGEVASALAATAIKQELEAEGDNVGRAPAFALRRAVVGANAAILEEASSHPEERGMGTTCTAALATPDLLAVAQVGDSRAYLWREGKLHALTRDQTLTAELLATGVLKQEDVARFPYRNMLAQALGTSPKVEPAMTTVDAREGDRLLLCSDGLHGPVSDETIAEILHHSPSVSEATDALVAAALDAGGPDNVTVIVADWGPLQQRPA